MRRVGIIGIPPPEERGRQIDRHSRDDFEPWVSELRLETQLLGHPLGRSPHGDEDDHEDNNDLAPKYLGRGHGEGSSAASPDSKSRVFSGVQAAAVGDNSDK